MDLKFKLNKWLIGEDFKNGDVIYIEKKDSSYIIRQLPLVNGAILVLDPHSGDILAMSGGFSFKLSQLIDQPKQRDSLDPHLSLLFTFLH